MSGSPPSLVSGICLGWKMLHPLLPKIDLGICIAQVKPRTLPGDAVSIVRGTWGSFAHPAVHHPYHYQGPFCQLPNQSPSQESRAGLEQKISSSLLSPIILGSWCSRSQGHLYCFHAYVNKIMRGSQTNRKPSRARVRREWGLERLPTTRAQASRWSLG